MRIEVSRRDNVMRIPAAALRFRPTNDMYTALGQEPPTPAGRGGAGRGANGAPGAPGATPAAAPGAAATTPATPGAAATTPAPAAAATAPAAAPQAAAAAPGRTNRGGDAGQNPFAGGGRTGGGRGQGGGMNASLTPEQQKQMEAIRALPQDQRAAAMAKLGINFGGGGRGGQAGGRGGRNSGNAGGPATPITQRSAQSIDELFPPIVRNPTRGQVYVLVPADATHKFGTLKRLDIMQGITNGTFTELVSGPPELTVGTELVSNIVMPWLAARTTGTTQGNPFSGQQPGRGGMPTGMGGGGGAPGGGGGGGGRGGGR
jgi:hypothetical protein